MFIYSVRASSVRFFVLIALVVVLAFTAVALGGASVYASAAGSEIDYSGIKTNEDRVNFIEGFGISVSEKAKEEKSFTMPENFDRVILGYNEIQKRQGLDLSKYARKKVTRYTYEVTNWDDEGESPVLVNLFVYRSKIVGCDVSRGGEGAFVLPLTEAAEHIR